ncbi:AbrB/MazE/SpoVT family DNA-binding domain-containing protein [Luteolibacter flavescens]|uniref:AbrB/MazE/SpoVT family DNA-binding domain-containing protein n=1 Tax=Luteolibacter flavescens TaxID=1859460 RepID=A0ABT3FP86_9BACT|nr:AbrB/MazE/SpoVT family DNA-binding domain-containing protein [Luteolibacter flavescens]MCW1885383.1 AbrB/MazE/SpoVT family DNA-binding domain-containing protein [Luteolibacter flavescens]
MTTVLSQKGQIVLPGAIRQQLQLQTGDDFEITVEDEDTIILRRIGHPANRGLVDLLLSCPASFEIPPREKDDSKPLEF